MTKTYSYRLLAIAENHFADYIEAEAFMQDKILSMSAQELQLMGMDDDEEEDSRILQMAGNIGIIHVKGRLTNTDSWLNRYFGFTSYNEIRLASMQAIQNGANVAFYNHDSPGGTVSGMADTANFISNMPIPTISFTSSAMMSADYFLASQTDYTYADEFSEVGSVGAIIKTYDRSKMLASMGIVPRRHRSGDLKASGDPDFKLTAKEEAYINEKVMSVANKFYNIVSEARGMSVEYMKSLGITDGGTYSGDEALAVNLIDGLKTFDESMLKALDLAKKVDKRDKYSLF